MKGFNRDQSHRWWLAVVLSMPVALAAALLMLFFPLTQAVQASRIPTVKSLPASQETTGLSSSSVITIGVGTLLSAPDAFGWAQANSVQLAINETNAAGGINVGGTTYTLALVSADDGCNPAQAVTAANTLLNAGAIAVVGHGCTQRKHDGSTGLLCGRRADGLPFRLGSSAELDKAMTPLSALYLTMAQLPPCWPPISAVDCDFSRSAVVEMPGYWQGLTEFYLNTFTTLGGTITPQTDKFDVAKSRV